MSEKAKPGIYISPENWDEDGPLVAVYGNKKVHVVAKNYDGTDGALMPYANPSLLKTWGVVPAKVVRADAIVIDRADLPTQDSILEYAEVSPSGDRTEKLKSGSAHLVIRGASPEYAESMARHYLALAQWLREHPPVDEASKAVAEINRQARDLDKRLAEFKADFLARASKALGVEVSKP